MHKTADQPNLWAQVSVSFRYQLRREPAPTVTRRFGFGFEFGFGLRFGLRFGFGLELENTDERNGISRRQQEVRGVDYY
jgi:hypothetical protein